MKEKQSIKARSGFTLIELIVVVTILGILSTIAVPKVLGQIERANYSADLANAKVIYDAMNIGFELGEVVDNVICVKGPVKAYSTNVGPGKIINVATKRMNSIPTTKHSSFVDHFFLDFTSDKRIAVFAYRKKPSPKYIELYPNPVPFEDILK